LKQLFWLYWVCVLLATTSSWALEGKVVGVHDGDTLTILDANKTQYKIRLAQIDAPEIGQSWGRNSKQALTSQVINRIVKIVDDWCKETLLIIHFYFWLQV
jgi:micrococcal nuclease